MTRGHDGHSDDDVVRDAIAHRAASAGFDVEDVSIRLVGGKRMIRVVVDRDGGVDLDAAAAVSHDIAAALDADHDDVLGDASYTLEVTSRGIGAPLTQPRHFRRAAGRLVALVTSEGAERLARIVAVDGPELVYLPGRDGVTPTRLPLAEIARAKAEVEFSPPSEAVQAVLRELRVVAPGVGAPEGEGGLER